MLATFLARVWRAKRRTLCVNTLLPATASLCDWPGSWFVWLYLHNDKIRFCDVPVLAFSRQPHTGGRADRKNLGPRAGIACSFVYHNLGGDNAIDFLRRFAARCHMLPLRPRANRHLCCPSAASRTLSAIVCAVCLRLSVSLSGGRTRTRDCSCRLTGGRRHCCVATRNTMAEPGSGGGTVFVTATSLLLRLRVCGLGRHVSARDACNRDAARACRALLPPPRVPGDTYGNHGDDSAFGGGRTLPFRPAMPAFYARNARAPCCGSLCYATACSAARHTCARLIRHSDDCRHFRTSSLGSSTVCNACALPFAAALPLPCQHHRFVLIVHYLLPFTADFLITLCVVTV